MGNILEAMRVSLLHRRIAELVDFMPKTMVKWKNRNGTKSTYASPKGGMISHEKVQEYMPKQMTIPEPLKELDLGSGETFCSGDLRGISLCSDVDIDNSTPEPLKEVETIEEVPIVDWHYMTTVPEYTWEELLEEQLWDDYTRQHSAPACTIPIEKFWKTEEQELFLPTMIDVTASVDGDTVILFQRSRKNRASDVDQSQTGDGQRDNELSKKKSKPKWDRFSFLPYMLFKRFSIKDPFFRANKSFMKGGIVT